MWWMWGPGGIWALFGVLIPLALVVGIVIVAVSLLRSDRHHVGSAPPSPALQVLEERYARGEITREEFLERHAVLLGHHPAAAPTQPPPPAAPGPPA